MATVLKQSRHYLSRRAASTWPAASRVLLAYELHRPRQNHLTNHSPIIFMHGFLGSKRENRGVSKLLAEDLSQRVFVVDLRNHGDSGHHPRHDYMEMALDVESFIKNHRLENAILIGHSMGAKTALTLALHAPDLISNVVAIDNCPIHLPLTEEFPRYLRGMAKVKDMQVRTHLEADRILKDFEESSSVRLFLLSNFVKNSNSPHLKLRLPVDILKTALGPLGDFPHKSKLVQFRKPTLFLRALRSHYIPQDAFPLISSFFPLSRIVDIDCGHWIVQDRPEEFRRSVVEFLQNRS